MDLELLLVNDVLPKNLLSVEQYSVNLKYNKQEQYRILHKHFSSTNIK